MNMNTRLIIKRIILGIMCLALVSSDIYCMIYPQPPDNPHAAGAGAGGGAGGGGGGGNHPSAGDRAIQLQNLSPEDLSAINRLLLTYLLIQGDSLDEIQYKIPTIARDVIAK